jgi:hypothetical protein
VSTPVRSFKGIKEGKIIMDGEEVRVGVVYGLGNAIPSLRL